MILDKLKIEVTKNPIHPVGKNGEHFIKSNQLMDIPHAFINCVKARFNHGLSPSEVDWGDPKGEHTKMLKYTSSGCMLMEVDWGGKLIANSMVYWGTHETYPNGHNISEVDWRDHDSTCNHMNEFSLSEVDWGAHDSSYFLYLVYIDLDAKPKDFFIQECGEDYHKGHLPPLSYA